MKILLVVAVGAALLLSGCSKPDAAALQPGMLTPAQAKTVEGRLADYHKAQLAQVQAAQEVRQAGVKLDSTMTLIKADLDLDDSWEANPHYGDSGSPDFHVLKFVKKAPAPPAPAPTATQPAAATPVPAK